MKEEYFKTKYKEISELSNTSKCRTVLIQNEDTNELAVKKEMPMEMYEVYSKLSSIDAENLGMVHILSSYIEDDKCIDIEEYINGSSLETVLNENNLQPDEGIRFVLDLCDTLNVLHKNGIIHRDIQPKNIIIDNGRAKLIDFDIARTIKEDSDKDTRLLGTPEYASPEAYGFSQTDERSDIFSLGKIIEELTEDEKYSHIISKCTEIDPSNRYQSVQELKDELFDCQNGTNESPLKAILKTVPGFKTDSVKDKVIATVIYLVVIVILTGTAFQAKGNIFVKIISALLFYIWIIVPYAFLMNIGEINNQVVSAKYQTKRSERAVRIMLCIVSFIITSILLGVFISNH